jgi:hypothetical protein
VAELATITHKMITPICYLRVEVGKRFRAFKIPPKGIFPGAKVKSKRPVLTDGEVLEVVTWKGTPRSAVHVKWGDFSEQILRVGYEGKV